MEPLTKRDNCSLNAIQSFGGGNTLHSCPNVQHEVRLPHARSQRTLVEYTIPDISDECVILVLGYMENQ